jgi:hypothetical protein
MPLDAGGAASSYPALLCDGGTVRRAIGSNTADLCVTVDEDCHIQCEVLGSRIEFRFDGDQSGLHLFFDGAGFAKFLKVAALMVGRLKDVAAARERANFVVGDDEQPAGDEPGAPCERDIPSHPNER